jgi:hypothetical protein
MSGYYGISEARSSNLSIGAISLDTIEASISDTAELEH